ncbi:MAG: lytic transglycosylase domain-containing protein [Myxococcota bacterium]
MWSRINVLTMIVVTAGCLTQGTGPDEPPPTPEAPAYLSIDVPEDPSYPAITLASTEPVTLSELPWRDAERVERAREADRLLVRGRVVDALEALGPTSGSAAALLRARAFRRLGDTKALDEAAVALRRAETDSALADLVSLEQGLLASATGDSAGAIAHLMPLLGAAYSVAVRAALPAVAVMQEHDPAGMLQEAAVIEAVLPKSDFDAQSVWLEAQAVALDALGRADEARAMRLRRYLEQPVSLATPTTPPEGTTPTKAQLLGRAEVLLEAHRNERVIEALEPMPAVPGQGLTAQETCRRSFALGLASRKLRHYAAAETYLTRVVNACKDQDLVRRAMYLNAKVISIRGGLRAVPVIEAFAKKFKGHSMVDDVLFWAGDMYQRRQRWDEATKYYNRIETLEIQGDYCGAARWRQAWIAFRRGKPKATLNGLSRILHDEGCVAARFDRARAHYWLGRLHLEAGRKAYALKSFRSAIDVQPLGFYGQMSLARVQQLDAKVADVITAELAPPVGDTVPPLCPGALADNPALGRALELLVRGLGDDASRELLSIKVPEQDVLAKSHAVSLGLDAKPAQAIDPLAVSTAPQAECPPSEPRLLLALLLDRAGAYREAHWRLRTNFADVLAKRPAPDDAAVWRAAYPLAFRDLIAEAEREAGLPNLFLQALSREESALDPEVVSWAGAYGLTQLLLSSGKAAGKLLDPPVSVSRAEDLLEPALNARLGGALLGSQVRKFGGNTALALAAYNAGDSVALTWWKRHQGQPFDVFAEEMTIKETRGYVKRVLETYGIYRWLYEGKAPILPIETSLPKR